MSVLTDLRSTVYTTIAVKQTNNQFYYANDFVLEETWRPWETLENLFDPNKYPHGILYIIGGRPGDMVTSSRTNMVLRDYPIHLGFQHAIADISDLDEIDTYVGFVEEIEETLRVETDNNLPQLAFNRLEPMRDPNGVPFSFILLREASLFEAYFTAFFSLTLAENIATTTTT